MPSALTRRCSLLLGLLYLALGLLEVVTHRDDTVLALLFWGASLLGGGSLVLLGVAVWPRRPLPGLALVLGGGVVGFVATAWTLVVPVLMLAVVVLNLRDYAALTGPGGQPPNAST